MENAGCFIVKALKIYILMINSLRSIEKQCLTVNLDKKYYVASQVCLLQIRFPNTHY